MLQQGDSESRGVKIAEEDFTMAAIVERFVSAEEFVLLRVGSLIANYSRSKRLDRVVVLTERDPDTVRGPDIFYWSAERLPLDQNPKGYPDVAADLCVEVLSPSNTLKEILGKMREYFAIGVRMVWIIDPEDRTIRLYRSTEQAQIYHETATFSGEDVLPGFTCKVSDLFE